MGYLTEQIADEVGRLTQERGRQYFHRGAVKSIDGDHSSVHAVVQGTIRYDVEITSIDEFLDYSCSCPYFERDLEPCKHIWAVSLAAEQEGYLRGRESFSALDSFAPVAKLVQVKNPQPAPSWKKQLEPLLNSLQAAENRSRFSAPTEREFIYIIDVSATRSAERLVIDVAQRERRTNGLWGKLKTKKLGLNELGDIADPADRRILAILFGSRRDLSYAYSPYYRESTDPNFALPAPLWDVVLPLMCASGRCVLRFSLNNNEHLPAVQWDDGAPWEFYLRVAPAEDGAHYRVTGGLRRGDADMPRPSPIDST